MKEDFQLLATHNTARDFEKCISTPRFNRYLHDHPDQKDAISVYLWNMALCEALYPTLQTLEITYRNALNEALANERKTATWYDDTNFLLGNEQQKVIAAKRELGRQRKPSDPCRVVAELSFGFWVALYSRPYRPTIVHSTIATVFSNAPRRLRNASDISNRLQGVRKLRNRVFHHEPIWHWVNASPNLSHRAELFDQYQTILTLINWIGPAHHKLIRTIDNFEHVYSVGWGHYRKFVEDVILAEQTALEVAHANAAEQSIEQRSVNRGH